ncbi:MAG: DUF6798 domain-containing protein, partial [Saprospiraceae bacterium]
WRSGNTDPFPWKFICLYVAVNIIWFYFLVSNNGSHSDPKSFMYIMEFRLSHHFFASYFGMIHLVLSCIFALTCFWFYSGKLRWMFVMIVAGCLFYELGVEILRLPIVLYTQWWKTTIWLEAFAFIAIVTQVEKNDLIQTVSKNIGILLPVGLFAIVCYYRLSGLFGNKPDYMFPWYYSPSEDVVISRLAQQKTPDDAVFIIPPDLTAFRWYSRRSQYVDYKAMIHTETFLKEWYFRIGSIYDYDLASKRFGVNFSDHADTMLSSPSPRVIQNWKSHGITHIISPKTNLIGLMLISSTSHYCLYQIP